MHSVYRPSCNPTCEPRVKGITGVRLFQLGQALALHHAQDIEMCLKEIHG